jgi:hypothetical protein
MIQFVWGQETRRLAPGQTIGQAKIQDFTWLTGNWQGQGLGDFSEENWQTPQGGSMLGTFRQHKQGKPWFYEFMLLLEVEGSVQLQVKHFNPDGKGWEEKDDFLTFRLIEVKPGVAYFEGLTFRRQDDQLEIFLAMASQEVRFDLRASK